MTTEYRKTTQQLLPEKITPTPEGAYDVYPGFKVEEGTIKAGYPNLAKSISRHKVVLLDGYAGVLWEELRKGLSSTFEAQKLHISWINFRETFKPEQEIDVLVEPFLGGEDPIFGTRTTLTLQELFDTKKIDNIHIDPKADINIIYGTGASLAQQEGSLYYVDLPKNELQFRMRAGAITNLGKSSSFAAKAMYKRFYFVDWILLNKHKQTVLAQIDTFIDDQRAGTPVFMDGDKLREGLSSMSRNFFRVRPWFEPGAWGGQWIRENISQLSADVPNYAWSFELIVPENGLLFEDKGRMLECSFDLLMFQEYKNVLGHAADRFGVEFPIRFDFLDTVDGGNLSVQVHPKEAFIKSEFGENFTQDECYYILEATDEAGVYLGFQNEIKQEDFRNELEESFTHKTEVDIEKHVNKFPAQKHDLFLIPSGTIHSAGKGNLVLEISATPYIFTFKLYDWLRLDLDGKPRPLNLERGFLNLDFSRKGPVVTQKHISKPKLIEAGDDWKTFHLPTHEEHFYDVHRLEFETRIKVSTKNQCHVLSLVEGTSLLLITDSGLEQRFNYAETFVVPAACQQYTLVNEGPGTCKVVKAFVKS
ncbi:MAG: hypothetical protein DWQ02_19595 [Bacteroidetes bacterium]|nr:MAG: hypothetical protein DWQ02_19595 [Bacteroidota bacterium]